MTNNSSLKFYSLTFVSDTHDITVGRPDTETYAVFPPDGVALLQQLQAGLTPDSATMWYEQHYGEPIDINDFLDTLRDLGFLREDEAADETPVPQSSSSVKWQWWGRAAFSPMAWTLYAILFGYCVYDMVRFPHLRPAYQNVFFSPYFTVIELSLFLSQFPGIFFHELYHVLAGRRLGIASRLGFGRRLYFLVFETSLTGLWSVPRRSRYLPFLAGMLADTIWFSLLTIIAGATMTSDGRFSPIAGICAAFAFATILRFQWQFYFYLRTDLYYVFTNIFSCVDLQQTTQRYLLNRIWRVLGRTEKMDDETQWNPRDRQVAPWYAPFYVLGCLLSISVSLFVAVPITIQFLFGTFAHLFGGSAISPSLFWDSFIFLMLNVLQLIVVAVVFLRERKQQAQVSRASLN